MDPTTFKSRSSFARAPRQLDDPTTRAARTQRRRTNRARLRRLRGKRAAAARDVLDTRRFGGGFSLARLCHELGVARVRTRERRLSKRAARAALAHWQEAGAAVGESVRAPRV